MALTEIALLKWQTNKNIVFEDCWFAVQLSRRIWGKSRVTLIVASGNYVWELYALGVISGFREIKTIKEQIQ